MQRPSRPVLLTFLSGIAVICALPLFSAAPAKPGAPKPTVAKIAAKPSLEQQFRTVVRPFVEANCVACHSGASPAAQFDISAYTSMDSVVKDPARWSLVMARLSAKEMPPAAMPQPTDAGRKQVIDWIDAMRAQEVAKHAGDPGTVLARRLSNSEYNYTIRDLTGIDMRPTREFPVDPANLAGFDNSGESLTMSPGLLNKYLQAAREVGDHMVLKPDGFDFAAFPMLVETDREKYTISRIVDFYKSQPTDLSDYFLAAWRYKNRAQIGKPNMTLAAAAIDTKVSPKYLPVVWALLEEPAAKAKDEVGPVAKLQDMWRKLPAPLKTQPDIARSKCNDMRDFVVRIRRHTAMQYAAPFVKGLSATSQPLMNWKLYQYAAHRRDSDPKALRVAVANPAPLPPVGRMPDLGQEAAVRYAAVIDRERLKDPDLAVPADQMEKYQASFQRLANVFPDNFYISERGRFFPDDTQDKGRLLSAGFHNVMGYMRDDTPLIELIIDDKQKQQLDRLWDEFDYIADYTNRTYNQYFFNQSGEVDGNGRESGSERPLDRPVEAESVIMEQRDKYLKKWAELPTNDATAQQAIKDHYARVNVAIRRVEKMRADSEPKHLDALLKFAAKAYRRPLTAAEQADILAFYKQLRTKGELSHEDAMRDSVVSILMSPDFCYRIDLRETSTPAPGSRNVAMKPIAALSGGNESAVRALSPYALASRLSYFIWSSMPDQELLDHAAAGDLPYPEVLLAQTKRMLKDSRALGLATEFGGNWLDFRRFETLNSVDRERFPTFTNDLREAMFEEPVHFLGDLIRNDRSVFDMLYGDYTFVNPVLAKHYGMPDVKGDNDTWVKIDDARKYQRGGILPMSVFLTQNSPGLRTSPVKRGYWVVRRVLGEVIPPPPPVVPELPHDEAKSEMAIRDMLAKHRENPVCASCHAKFDVFGLVFENFGPVGDSRTKDLAGRPVDVTATFPGGSEGAGVQGVQTYIKEHRQPQFIDGLSRKLLSYALNRSLILSDEPVIERMKARLAARAYHFDSLVETIVASQQFLNQRNPAAGSAAGTQLAQR